MRKEQIIISVTETYLEGIEAHQVHAFPSPAEAKAFIHKKLDDDLAEARKSVPELKVKATGGDEREMWNRNEGEYSFAIGAQEYFIAFLRQPAEYGVTVDETVSCLDAFCNAGRTSSDFKRVAEHISDTMHRYVQSELWKFVKQLIRAFASGRFDERNQTAHNQAQAIVTFMDEDRTGTF